MIHALAEASLAALTSVVIALVTVAGVLGAAYLSYRAAREARLGRAELKSDVADVAAMVTTNHGKRPGEYLEQIADLRTEVGLLAHQVDRSMSLVFDKLVEHTAQDAENFAALREAIGRGPV